MDTNYEWNLNILNLSGKEFPLRHFEFEFADTKSLDSYMRFWWVMYPKETLSLEDLKNKQPLTPDDIRGGETAIAFVKQFKDGNMRFAFKTVEILENFKEESSESHIKCRPLTAKKVIYVPINYLFTSKVENVIQLTGLEEFEFKTEFRKIILNEKLLYQSVKATFPVWKGTHCSVTLWNESKETNINEKLRNLMICSEKSKATAFRSNSLEKSATLCSINEDIGSWVSEKENPYIVKNSTIRFHVSDVLFYGEEPSLIVHPAKYWNKFKQMEKSIQDYGQKNLNEFYCNFEEKGSFLLAAREEKDEDGNQILKFYRGYHTGEISIAGGTHRIAFVDYFSFVWVENGNMLPLPPEYCQLPMMGGKCRIRMGDIDEIPRKGSVTLRDCHQQKCSGVMEKFEYLKDLFPVFNIRDIKIIPSISNR